MANASSKHLKYKLDRRLGVNILGRLKSTVQKRNTKPGMHGNKKKAKPSDYGIKIMECAKIRHIYGNITFKTLMRVIGEALHTPGLNEDNIARILQSRLDAVVYDAKFAATPWGAKQLVSHGHIKVNGKKVNIGSYRTKIGDIITLDESMYQNEHVAMAVSSKERDIESTLSVNKNVIEVLAKSNASAGKFQKAKLNFNTVIEFISRRV